MTSPPFAICSDDDDAFGAVDAVAPPRTNTACATADDGVSPFPVRNAFTSSAILSIVGPF